MTTLAATVFDPTRLDGWIHLALGDWSVAKTPFGVVAFLLLVPGFRLAGPRHRVGYVVLSSLLLAWATIGAAYVALLVAATVFAWAVILATHSALRRSSGDGRGIIGLGGTALVVPYAGLLLFPQPAWLPRVEVPVYFYLQWAGLAYLTLKAIQVILDLGQERTPRPRLGVFAAFLLFAPTLRMGPIYRWADFCRDLEAAPPAEGGAVRAGLGRIAVGLWKMGVMAVLLNNFPAAQVFDAPQTLGTGALLLHIYAQPISIYLWIAGYSDLAIGLGQKEANSFLPFSVKTQKREYVCSVFDPPGKASLLAGIGPADAMNRDPKEIELVAGGATVVGDGVLAVAPGANVVFCQRAPWEFEYRKYFNQKRTFRRVSCLVTRVLGNMGVDEPAPLLRRFSSPVKGAAEENRWLTGFYLDSPQEFDDPYRYFQW